MCFDEDLNALKEYFIAKCIQKYFKILAESLTESCAIEKVLYTIIQCLLEAEHDIIPSKTHFIKIKMSEGTCRVF